jgi:hypothetical protein
VSVQQQVLPRVSIEVSYTRRWLNHFAVTDNTLVAPSDFGTFSITAPSDSRLPGGGGYVISNLYNVNNNKFGQSFMDNTFSDYLPGSPLQYSHYNGVLLNVSARPRNGLMFTGGINTGETVTDNCAVRALLNDLTVTGGVSPTNPYCHSAPGFITRFNGLASYVIPKVEVSLGLTIRSDQGDPLAANWAAPNSVIAPSLGRNLSGGQPNATINLVAPGAVWGNRVNEVDLRVGKILRFWRTRTNVGIDIFNLTNSAAILTYNQTFVQGGTWLAPLSVLTPRFVKLSAQISF